MRHRLAALTLALLLVVSISGIAFAGSDEIADDFSSGDYSGSTGSEGWLGHWEEIGDSGDPTSGSVRVRAHDVCHDGKCLVIEPLVGAGALGAGRTVDLTDAATAELRYRLDFPGGLLLNGSVEVKASADGGNWSTLREHEGDDNGHFSEDLPLGDEVEIRFIATGLSLTSTAGIDDIEIRVERPDPTTTTTTTITTTSTTTTTTTATTPSTTSAPPTTTTSSTSTTKPRPTTTTTVPAPEPTPGTTRPPTTKTTTTTTTTVRPTSSTTSSQPDVPSTDVPAPSDPPPVITVELPSDTEGVVTDLDPGLAPSGPRFEAQEDLLVRFGLAAEDIGLDILGHAVLGLVLGWAWLKRES